ncbi:MAG: hypothetical protein CYG61_08385 [Actinobacteria bacterium]|nr:MAG: hypothetical protein CYG61_08385 [Actinomycetota bacterium]
MEPVGCRAREIAVVAVVAALATVTVGSCGDTERLTRKEFVARGNAVCAGSEKKLQKAFAEELSGEGQPTAQRMQAVLRRVVPITEGTVADLKKLEPPENLEERFDAALVEAEEAIAALEKAAASPEAAQALFSDEEDPFEQANKGFESVGITACSQGGSSGEGAGEGAGMGIGIGMGIGPVTFSATEYEFAGTATMRAGKVTVALSNRGKERHEMSIVRLKDGVTTQQVVDAEAAGKDTEELVADDEVGGVGLVDAGAVGTGELDLVPGTYGYACFADAPDGEPHVAKGMFGQFIVS